MVDGVRAVPDIGDVVDRDELDAAAVGAEGVVVTATQGIVVVEDHVARHVAADHGVEKRGDQIVEVRDADRGAGTIEIHILQARGVDAVADADRGDVHVQAGEGHAVDEVIPVGSGSVGQRVAAGAGLLVRIAVAEEEDLIVPAGERRVDGHRLLDAGGEVGVAIERP